MLIDRTTKSIYQNMNDATAISVDGKALAPTDFYIIDDDSEIARKAVEYFPDFDFAIDNDELVDIVKVEHIPTVEELRSKYERLTVEKIRLKYTDTDETKILREALASGVLTDFDVYNAYVEECKTAAHAEIYGDLAAVKNKVEEI